MSTLHSRSIRRSLATFFLASVILGSWLSPADAAQLNRARAYDVSRNLNIDVRLINSGGINDDHFVRLWRDNVRPQNRNRVFKSIILEETLGRDTPIFYDPNTSQVSITGAQARLTFHDNRCTYLGKVDVTLTDADRDPARGDSMRLVFQPNRKRKIRGCPKPRRFRVQKNVNVDFQFNP